MPAVQWVTWVGSVRGGRREGGEEEKGTVGSREETRKERGKETGEENREREGEEGEERRAKGRQ